LVGVVEEGNQQEKNSGWLSISVCLHGCSDQRGSWILYASLREKTACIG